MPDGSFHPCERTGNVMPIGDVKAGIVPARVGRLQREFHDALTDRCRDCWALRLCGLCFAAQASCSDRTGAKVPPSALCEALCRTQERALTLVVRTLALPDERRAWLEATKVS